MKKILFVACCTLLGLVGCDSDYHNCDLSPPPSPDMSMSTPPSKRIPPYNVLISVCGDGLCALGETCDSCPTDCGECPPPTPVCNDGVCNGNETCSSCPTDCGECPPSCGDGVCNGDENCDTCQVDCSQCAPPPPYCGDGICNGEETCDSCAYDCGACEPRCGDSFCNGQETCETCACDCGPCAPPPPSCGDGVCGCDENCSTCPADCGACDDPRCVDLKQPAHGRGTGHCNGKDKHETHGGETGLGHCKYDCKDDE